MLCAAALFCVGASLIAMPRYVLIEPLPLMAVSFAIFGSTVGAAIGCLSRKTFLGASIGARAGILLFLLAIFWIATSSDL
ncbi:MAG TPA: hypothetical protein VHX65_12400 [Pirellulales bacterium]|jgi:hypothetical protein|nr:hypothetical protein [Pirellulales bacterium]